MSKTVTMKRFFSLFMLVLAKAFVAVAAQAQQRTITGTVVDNFGEPLVGATVVVPGTTIGTTTDIDGKYQLTVDRNVRSVMISFVGFQSQAVAIRNNKADARLAEDSKVMDDVVVIGYGSVKKGDITNAVAQIKAEELADRPVVNIASALQGELAGVDIQTTSGAPGSSVSIKVRGATSINEDGNSNPLYVVDGIPMDEDFDFQNLNPQDIASIEVLKDASSSAIYGSRGANGVILITSKQGNDDGKTRVTASANFSLSTPERLMDVMTPEEWIAWRTSQNYNYYTANYGQNGAHVGDTYAEQVTIMNGGNANTLVDKRWSLPGYGGLNLVDWQKAMFKTAIAQTYNLSISQGNKTSNYRASVGYVKQNGTVIHTGYDRLNAKIAAQTTVKDRLVLKTDVALQLATTRGGNVDGKDNAAQSALSLAPVTENAAGLYTAAEPYNRYIYAGSTISPVAMMEQRTYRDEQFRGNASLSATYTIAKGLTAEVLGSWIFNNRERHVFTPSTVTRNWSAGEGYAATGTWTGSRAHKYMAQGLVTYDHTWLKRHHLNMVAGASFESAQDGSSYSFGATQFPNNTILGINAITDVSLSSLSWKYTTDDHLVSYFARAEYGYDSRYLINASVRRDGSSRFGTNRKWGTFPAVSVAWRLSQEAFWNDEWWVNQAKIRVSYGSNGSNSIPLNSADGVLTSSNYSQDGTTIAGYIPSSNANPDLGWQKTNSWNFGIDMSLLQNRISFAADYYIKTIEDMLYQVTLPAVIGYSKGYSNIGNIRNQGIELELKTENVQTRNFKWSTKLSASWQTNEVKDLGANSRIYTGFSGQTQVIEVGHPVGEYFLYIADGVYMNEEDLVKYPTEGSSVIGATRYRDVNRDGIINEDDRTYCGKPQPSWTIGVTNTFSYKNWDASFLVTSQLGGKIWSGLGRAIDMQYQGNSINRLKHWQDEWQSPANPGNGIVPASVGIYGSTEEQFSTRWLYSTDFVKIKNLTIGYRLKLKKKFVEQLRFTASAENLWMWDRYSGGFSPESNNSGSSVSVYDYGAYPAARTISFGVQVQF